MFPPIVVVVYTEEALLKGRQSVSRSIDREDFDVLSGDHFVVFSSIRIEWNTHARSQTHVRLYEEFISF